MVVEIKRQVCDGHMLKWLIAAGLAWLEHNQQMVNAMNVFPVPDGDTGTNMRLTMQKAYDAIAHHEEKNISLVSGAVAKGALLGARGNSGVILSQLLAGFAEELQNHELLNLPLFARACDRAVKKAYQAVNQPVEGTILTVARESSEALSHFAAHSDSNSLIDGFEILIAAGREALHRTPELLPILKKAGVVDSGGQGLIVILEGMARLLNGDPVHINRLEGVMYEDQEDWQNALEPEDEEGYGYDVQFLIRGEQLDVTKVRADINAMGWSTLVVGDPSLIKVHVHVHDPGVPLSYAISLGAAIDDIVVENMQMQYEGYVARRAAEEEGDLDEINEVDGIAVIAVASGDGLRSLLKQDLGVAAVISGGQTMNPSTEEFMAMIERLPNQEIILLPNNKNIILAAEQAMALARDKQIRVVPSRSVPQGIAALVNYISVRDTGSLDEVAAAMREALRDVVTCEITTATRDVEMNGVEVVEGQYIGLIDGQLATSGAELDQVIMSTLTEAGAGEFELVTLYYGSQIAERQAQALLNRLSSSFTGQEFNVVYGGQPLYPYLVSLE